MQTQDFFRFIAYKYRKENDLSDITWAMCQSCESFRDFFLKFFFPEIQINTDISIEREKSENDSRPDFYIDNGGILYLIENKIFDTNHHFGQYDQTFNIEPDRFGYITNYIIDDENLRKTGYRLHTWLELYDSFSNNLPDNEEELRLWQGYLEYVKNVCGIIKIEKPMKLDGIYSLFSLMQIFGKLTEREEEQFKVLTYNTNKLCGNGYSIGATGVNFELIYKNREKSDQRIWGWIGVYYDRAKPLVLMGFYDKPGWGVEFINKLRPYKSKWTKQSSFEKPNEEDSCLWFEMSKALRERFEESDDIKEQEKILKQFMDDVILYPSMLN